MTKKIANLVVVALLIFSITSCEKDFTDVGSNIIDNSAFQKKELIFDVDLTYENIDAVRTGNIGTPNLDEYLLGVYKKENAKTIEAGIVSQLLVPSPSNLKLKDEDLKDGENYSASHLDAIILKIPVKATLKKDRKKAKDKDDKEVLVPDFSIDSLLGNPSKDFTINVYRNGSYLSTRELGDVTKERVYKSDDSNEYIKLGSKLNNNENTIINFSNIQNDTVFTFKRTLDNGEEYESALKVPNGTRVKVNPFIAIPLDTESLRPLFDKYGEPELSSQEAFNDYFKGIIIEVIGEDGAMIPMNLSTSNNNLRPSIDIIHTTTIVDANGNPIKDEEEKIKRVERVDSFYLGGIRASTYKMTAPTSTVPSSVLLQGTAGSKAIVEILNKDSDNNGVTDLEELRKKNIIINDASLIFDINTSVADTTKVPKRLFLFKNEIDKLGDVIPTQLADLFSFGPSIFGGNLQLKDGKPDNYTFRIKQHIDDLIKGATPNSELTLRVYNSLDNPTSQGDIYVYEDYNWDPRSVLLLNNSSQKGKVRGVKLRVSYTEEK